MKLQFLPKFLVGATLTVAAASTAFAAGYEKSIMWGGKTGSVAGISTSYIEGADALYFNPAGLVAKAPGQDLSLNVSPVWSTFSGPYNNNDDVANSTTGLSSPLSLIYSNTINDQWAFGVGGFISGGSKVNYDNIDFGTGVNGTPSTKTDLQIGELSAGVAWKPLPTWKFGIAYRYVMARAAFSFINRAYSDGTDGLPAGTFKGLLNANLNDLKDQESALRFGVQWAPAETWHVGLTYRSEVPLQAAGNIDGTFYKNNALPISNGTVNSAPATAYTLFPQAITLGADHDFSDTWKGFAEVAWTNYARVDQVGIQTNTTLTVGGTTKALPVPALNQQWKDQWNARLGAAYMGWSWPVRFGYGLTTQVTSSDWARPTFTPPGLSHTLTAGSGHTFELGAQKLEFNGAAEYTFVSGDGNGRQPGDNTFSASSSADIRAGTYKTNSFAAHLGLAYLY